MVMEVVIFGGGLDASLLLERYGCIDKEMDCGMLRKKCAALQDIYKKSIMKWDLRGTKSW